MGSDRTVRARGARRIGLLLALAGGLAALFPAAARGAGGLVGALYQLNWEQTVDRVGATTTQTRALKHTLDLTYKGFLSPIVENEITLKIEQETRTNELVKKRVSPVITLKTKGAYWSMGVKRTIDDTNDPGTSVKTTDSFFTEVIVVPARKTLPDFKAKYTLDTDFEEGKTDTRKQGIQLSSIYTPTDWLTFRGDYNKNRMDDRIKEDADTYDEKSTGSVGIRRLVTQKIKLDAEYKVEVSRGATFLSAGGATSEKEDQLHTVKSLLQFRPAESTDMSASYDLELKENMVTGEHTYTRNPKVAVIQSLGPLVTVKADFNRMETEARHTADDNLKTEDTWTVDAAAKFTRQIDLTAKHQNKHVREEQHPDNAKNLTNTTVTDTASWNAELTSFWKANASYERTSNYLFDIPTRSEFLANVTQKYALKSTMEIRDSRLKLEPTYDISLLDDFQARLQTETRDFRFKISWAAVATYNLDVKLEHTYDRKIDSSVPNVQRTDTSAANIAWREPFRGWTFGVDLNRTATDTSQDDLPPDITSTFGFRADYKFDTFLFSTTEKYDKKKLADSTLNADVKAEWVTRYWGLSLTYSYRKTFAVVKTDGYTISVAFKYNL